MTSVHTVSCVLQVIGTGEVPERDFSLLHGLSWVGSGRAVSIASSSGLVYTFRVSSNALTAHRSLLATMCFAVLFVVFAVVVVCVALRATPFAVLSSLLE